MPTTELQEEKAPKVDLTPEQIAEVTTGNPIFVKEEVELAGQKFKIHFLPYDDQIAFLTLFAPVFDDLLSRAGKVDSSKKLDFMSIINLCRTNLPEMGRIVLKQSKPEITIQEVKVLCNSPVKIIELVLLQVKKNNLIQEFSTFFPQLMTLLN